MMNIEQKYNEPVPIRNILSNKDHPDYAKVSEIMRKVQAGDINLCGCMGKVGSDQYCPCEMRAKGLTPSNPWTNAKIEELKRALNKYETE